LGIPIQVSKKSAVKGAVTRPAVEIFDGNDTAERPRGRASVAQPDLEISGVWEDDAICPPDSTREKTPAKNFLLSS
jgi:hypothetical protein